MVAVVSGSALGLFGSSASILGGGGGVAGNATAGRGNDRVFLNAATGNLLVQSQDDVLTSLGLDLPLVRTYNSQGLLDDDNGDNWRLGVHQRVHSVTGTLNGSGSTVKKTFGDGTEVLYGFNTTLGKYMSLEGDGAHDTLSYDSGTSQWTWTDGSRRNTETYNSSGQLTHLKDADNNTATLTYTGSLLTQIADASGQQVFFDYTGNNLTAIREVSSSQTQTLTRYYYDGSNRLRQVVVDLTPADNTVPLPDANSDGLYETVANETYITTYTYDGTSKRVASITQSDGSSVSFTYQLIDSEQRVASYSVRTTTTPTVRTSTIQYTLPTPVGGKTLYRQTDITDSLTGITTYKQDASGRRTSVLSPTVSGARIETSYGYDGSGNVTSITEDPTGLNRITVLTYDNSGNLLTTRDSLGNSTARSYNSSNQLLTLTEYTVPDPDGPGAGLPSGALTTRYAYDSLNHLRFAISGEGRVTEHRYNASGQRTSSRNYVGGVYTAAPFAESDLVTWSNAQDRTKLELIEYVYDFRSNLSTVRRFLTTDSTGAGTGTPVLTKFIYDQRGQLLQTIEPRGSAGTPNASTPNLPYATTYVYDGLGRVLSTTQWISASSLVTTLNQYDDANRVTKTTFADGLLVTKTYNCAGELISVQNGTAASPALLGTTTYAYDAGGRLRIITNPLLAREFCFYDAANRKIGSVDADGTLTEFIYNKANQLIKTIQYAALVDATTLASLVDGSGNPTSVAFSTVRTAASGNAAQDRITRNVYDNAGRLVYTIDEIGAVTQLSYDGANRLTQEMRYATPVTIARSVDEVLPGSFTITANAANDRRSRRFYDADGKLAATLDGEGYLVENLYDAAGHLWKQISYATQTNSSFWATGTLTDLRPALDNETTTTPEQDVVRYFFYDALGRQSGELDGEGYLTETRYSDDVINHRVRYNHVLTYTSGATLASLKAAVPSTALRHTTEYVYDGAEQLTEERNYKGTSTTNYETIITRHSYDARGRLLSTTAAQGSTEERTTRVRYDLLGRVLQELNGAGSQALIGLTDPTAINNIWDQYGVAYEYDLAGRRISATSKPDNTQTNKTLYFYDTDDRLRFEVNQLGEVIEHRYNALGQRTDTIAYTARISTASLVGGAITSTLTTRVTAAANNASDAQTVYAYTLTGKVSSITVRRTTVAGEDALTTRTYNAFGEQDGRTVQSGTTAGALGHTYQYDRRGLLTVTTWDPGGFGTTETRQYDAFARLTRITDARGNVAKRYEYDRLGREVAHTESSTSDRTITTYDAFSRTLTVRDALLNTTTYVYTDSTRTVTMTTPESVQVVNVFNRHGQELTVTAGGNTTTYGYNRDGQLTSTSDSLGSLEGRTYDRRGRQVTQTDARGTITQFAYDAANRVFQRIVTVNSALGGSQLITTYTYDGQGRVIRVDEPNGRRTDTTYYRDGRIDTVAVDPLGFNLRTRYTYDRAGRTLTVTEGYGSTPASAIKVTEYRYDRLGRRTQQIIDPGTGTNPATGRAYLNLTTDYKYDANGNLTRKIEKIDATTSRSTWYIYDTDNRVTHQIDALGGVVQYTYDLQDRVTLTRRYFTALTPAVISGLGDIVTSVTTTTNNLDHLTQSVYDRDGREAYTIEAISNTQGVVTERTFDALGSVTRTRTYANAVAWATFANPAAVATALTTAGNSTSTVGANDRVSWTAYDVRGRVRFSVNGVGAVTRYDYDSNGNLASTTVFAKPRSATLAMDFAALDVWTTTPANTSPADRRTRFWYDSVNRLRFTLDAEGYLTERVYNDAARTETVTVYAAKPTIPTNPTTADLAGRINGVVIPVDAAVDQPTTTLYDAAGRVSRVTDALGNYEEYTYDGVSNRKTVRDKRASIWTYDYDAAGRLIEERSPNVTVSRLNTAGATVTTSEAIVTRYDYNGLGQLKSKVEGHGTAEARTTTYQYDVAGRRTFETISVPGAASNIITEYRYDAKNNLTRKLVQVNASTTSSTWYVYDAMDRMRFTVDALGDVTEQQYNTTGEVVHVRRYAAPISPPTGTNVLTSVTATANNAADQVTQYAYDRVGRRVFTSEAFLDAGGAVRHRVTEEQYSPVGDVIRRIRYNATAGAVTLATPDAVRTALGNPSGPAATDRVMDSVYDRRGLLAYAIELDEANRGVTRYQYDANGNQTVITRLAAAYTSSARDFASLEAWVPGNSSDANDRTLRHWYDKANRRIYTRDADGYLTRTAYTAKDEALETLVFAHQFAASAQGATQLNVTKITDVDTAVASWVGDAANQLTTNTIDAAGRVTGVLDATRTFSEAYGYDTLGNRISFTNKKGSVWTYVYDAAGRLLEERTPLVDFTTLTRAANGALSADPVGTASIVTRMTYDAMGNVKSRQEGIRRTVSGGTPAENTTQSRTTSYGYDLLGRQTVVTYPPIAFYDFAGDSVSALTALSTTTTYDALGYATRNADVGDGKTYRVYDALGRVVYEVDALNQVTRRSYDVFDNETSVTRFASPTDVASLFTSNRIALGAMNSALVTHADDRTINKDYDRVNRVWRVREPTVYVFDTRDTTAAGNKRSYEIVGPVTVFKFSAFGEVTRESRLVNGKSNNVATDTSNPDLNLGAWANTYSYYNRRGQAIAVIDAGKYLTRYFYDDASGDLTRQIEFAKAVSNPATFPATDPVADATTGADRRIDFAYDKLNRKTGETRVGVQYSSSTGTAASGNVETVYDYDAVGNVVRTRLRNVPVVGAADPWIDTYTYYDVLGRAIAIAEPDRNRGDGTTLTPITTMRRDVYGNVVMQTQYANNPTSAPALGAPPTIAGDGLERTTYSVFDPFARVTQTNDPTGAQQYAAYTKRGELGKEWQTVTNDGDPGTTGDNTTDLLVTRYKYDAVGQQIEIREWQTGSTWTSREARYNAFGEIDAKAMNRPTTGSPWDEYFVYDKGGRIVRTNAGDGVHKIYLYDLGGQATAELKSPFDGSVDLSTLTSTTADTTSNLLRTERVYDLLGRATEQREPSFAAPNPTEAITSVDTMMSGNTPLLFWTLPSDLTVDYVLLIDGVNRTSSVTLVGSEFGYTAQLDLTSAIYDGTHSYELRFTREGATTLVAKATGTFTKTSTAVRTISNSVETPGAGPPAANPVSGLTSTISGGLVTMEWTAPADSRITAALNVNGSNYTATLVAGNKFRVTGLSLATGSYTYTITHSAFGQTLVTATGTLTVQQASSTTTTTVGTPLQTLWSTIAMVSASELTAPPASVGSVSSSSPAPVVIGTDESGNPIYGPGWSTTPNQVGVSWTAVGSGTMYIVLDYVTGSFSSSNPPYSISAVGAQRTFTLSNVSAGTTLSWTDTLPGDGTYGSGGISSVSRVRVYDNATGQLLRDTAQSIPLGTRIQWAAPADTSYLAQLQYKLTSSGTWTTLDVPRSGSTFLIDLPFLANGTYDFAVTQYTTGGEGPTNVSQKTGQFSVSGTSASVLSQTSVPACLSTVTSSGSTLQWSGARTAGDTLTVTIRDINGAIVLSPTPSTSNGTNFSVDLFNLATATYTYEIRYALSGTTYLTGGGSIAITTSTTPINPSASVTAPSSTTFPISWVDAAAAATNSDVLSWSLAAMGGVTTTATLTYTINGGASNSATFSGPGSFAFSSVTGNQNATIGYSITYRRTDTNKIYAYGEGTFTFTVTTTNNYSVSDTATTSLPATTATPRTLQFLDRWGNVTSLQDAALQTTTYTYNQMNQLVEVRGPASEAVSVVSTGERTGTVNRAAGTVATSTNFYDAYGRLVGTRDGNGNITQAVYNTVGQKIREVYADDAQFGTGTDVTYAYDAFGEMIEFTDAFGYRTRNAYDKAGRLIAMAQEGSPSALTGVATGGIGSLPAFNAAADVVVKEYGYDQAGRRISETTGDWLTGDPATRETVRYWYDGQDNVIKYRSVTGVVLTYAYDGQGRKIQEINSASATATWQYSYFGRLLAHTDFGQTQYTYNYNANSGLLSSQTSTALGADTWLGGQSKTFYYDQANHLTQIQDTGVNRDTFYLYDTVGRVARVRTIIDGIWHEDTRTEYDVMGRIRHLSGIGFAIQYEYDAAGNRTHIRGVYSPGGTNPGTPNKVQDLWYRYDARNRVTLSQGVAAGLTHGSTVTIDVTKGTGDTFAQGAVLTYDARGNRARQITLGDLIGGTEGEFTTAYAYDGMNRLLGSAQVIVMNESGTPTDTFREIDGRIYDRASRVTTQRTATLESGSYVDREQVTVYTDEGKASTQTTRKGGASGPIESVVRFGGESGYDSAGNLLQYDIDFYNSAGTAVQVTRRHNYEYRLGESYHEKKHSVVDIGTGGLLPGSTEQFHNKNGELIRFVDTADNARNRYFANNANGQVLTAVKGNYGTDPSGAFASALSPEFFFNSANTGRFFYTNDGRSAGSFSQLDGELEANFDVNYTPISSDYPSSVPGNYVTQTGDTLRTVAMKVFGDSSLWYLIAEANGLTDPDAAIAANTTLTIPNRVVSMSNTADSFKPYDIADALGDATPTQPVPPPPKKKKGCGTFAKILVIVVAIIVTVIVQDYSTTILRGALGVTVSSTGAITGGTALANGIAMVGGGIIGGAAGSIASQGVAMAVGLQDSFSWKSVAIGAISGGVSGGLTAAGAFEGLAHAASLGKFAPYVAASASALTANALTQGISIAVGLQDKFDWRSLAQAAVAAPLAAFAGQTVAKWIDPSGASLQKSAGATFTKFARDLASGITSTAVRAAMGGKFDVVDVIADVFGNAIGNSLVEQVSYIGQLNEFADRYGFDRRKAPEAVARLYAHQQGEHLLAAEELRSSLEEAWLSGGRSREDVDQVLTAYDNAGLTRLPRGYVEILDTQASNPINAEQMADNLARQDMENVGNDSLLGGAGRGIGTFIGENSPEAGHLLAGSGRVLMGIGEVIEHHPWVGVALSGLEIVAGPGMYLVRQGLNQIPGVRETFERESQNLNEGLTAGFFTSGMSDTAASEAALGAVFLAGLASGAVTSSVAGLRLVRQLDDLKKRITGAALRRLQSIQDALPNLQRMLPSNTRIHDFGFSRLGHRAVAVLENTDDMGGAFQIAAVLENADDLGRLANLDWNSLRRLHSAAQDAAAATLRNLQLSPRQLGDIEDLLAQGKHGEAFVAFQRYAGSEIHTGVARAWNEAGLISTRRMAHTGVDVPADAITAGGVPLPIELHPNSTYSFTRHIERDYPSYLTITYPSVTFAQFRDMFGSRFTR